MMAVDVYRVGLLCSTFITLRRSTAERGGCFQRRLFVCQHDNSRKINRRMMKLGGYVHSTKISPEFECQGQRQKVKVTGKKNEKFVRESPSGAARQFFGSGPRGRSPVRRWENQRMLSSL